MPWSRKGTRHLPHPVGIEIDDAGHEFGGDRAARNAQRGDVVEQPVLGVRRQVDQQALGQPRGRCRRVQSGRLERRRPVLAQIDGDGAPGGCGFGADAGQSGCLEIDYLRLIELVDHGPGRPGQPVSPRVQTGREDHRLPHAVVGGVDEVIVEVLGAHRHPVDHRLHACRRRVVDRRDVELTVHHLGEEIQPDRAHQWLGERIVDQTAGILRRHRAPGRDEGRGGADAGRQIPIVVVSAWHDRNPI